MKIHNSIKLTLAALTVNLASCGNPDADAARALVDSARENIGSGRYAEAIADLDTLNVRYPAQTAERREGLALRAQAFGAMARDSIEASSAALAAATIELDAAKEGVHHVDGPRGLEGYWLGNGRQPAITSATTVQSRVSDQGYFYLIANVAGQRIGLRTVSATSGADTYRSAPVAQARVIEVGSGETANFSPEESGTFGAWLASHPDARVLTLEGSRKNLQVTLNADLKAQILACYRYATAVQAQRTATINREKYERMLAIARDQEANLTPAPEQE